MIVTEEQAIMAIMAASHWRFEPGRFNGKAVEVLMPWMIDFWIR